MSDKKEEDGNVVPLPKSTHSGFYKDSDGSFGLRFNIEDLVEEAEEKAVDEAEEKMDKAKKRKDHIRILHTPGEPGSD